MASRLKGLIVLMVSVFSFVFLFLWNLQANLLDKQKSISILPPDQSLTDSKNNQYEESNLVDELNYAIDNLISLPLDRGIQIDHDFECFIPEYDYEANLDKRYPYLNRNVTCKPEYKFYKIENNILTINCESVYQYYFLGSLPDEEIFGRVPLNKSHKWLEYTVPVDIGKTEFGYAKCQDSILAFFFNKFNNEVSKSTQETRDMLIKMYGVNPPPRPLSVIFLMFDSLSREHFYTVFKDTVKFINESVVVGDFFKDYLVYDFQINNAQDSITPPNMTPLWFGETYTDFIKNFPENGFKQSENDDLYQQAQNGSIWRHFKKYGFVTVFGYETYQDYNAETIGRKILCDHVATNFWHGAEKIYAWEDFSERTNCLENEHSQNFLFNYSDSFVMNYKGHNKFQYLHLITGHEHTGSIIKSADFSLKTFLENQLKWHKENNEDFAIFIASDHGQNNDFAIRNEDENLVVHHPITFLLANKGLIQKIGPNTHKNLIHNSRRLVGKLDWHLTLKHLAIVPYYNLSTGLYNSWKERTNISKAISLFHEIVKVDKSCLDIKIPFFRCICPRFLPYDYKNSDDKKLIVDTLLENAINHMNKKLKQNKMDNVCSRIDLDGIIKAYHFSFEDSSIMGKYKIDFTIKNHPEYTFRASSFILSADGNNEIVSIFNHDWYDIENQLEFSQVKYSHVTDMIYRLDWNSGLCGKIGSIFRIKYAGYCVCQDPKDFNITENISKDIYETYEKLIGLLNFVLGSDNMSCTQTCLQEKKYCDTWALSITNNFKFMQQPWTKQNTYSLKFDGFEMKFNDLNITKIVEGRQTGISKIGNENVFVQGNWNQLSCETHDKGVKPLCPCSLIINQLY